MTAEEWRKNNLESKIQKQIIVYEHLIDGFKSIIPQLLCFDGKVVNVSLKNEIENVKPHSLLITINRSVIKIEDWKNKSYKRTQGYGHLCDIHRSANIVYKEHNLLDAYSTINIINCRIKEIENDIVSCKNDLQSFNIELEDWNKIVALVNEYEQKYSHRLKGSIDLNR